MSTPHDRLYDLLPGIIRLRDAERGEPLRGLLGVIAEQAARTEDGIRQSYENCFVETCEQQFLPYIGDLVGYRPLAWAPMAEGWGVPRRDIADTLRLRRRKGTLAVLADLVAAAAGWPARVTEDPIGPEVRVKVWRLRSFPLTRTRPFYQPRRINCFTFGVLGNDAQLYSGTVPPEPLTRDLLANNLDAFYGDGRSLCVYENGRPVAASRLVIRPLDNWEPEIFGDEVAVDPELGRLMYPEVTPRRVITTSTYYGFAAELGGGEYSRVPRDSATAMSLFRRGHLLAHGVPFLARLWSGEPFSDFLRALIAPDLLARIVADAPDPARLEQILGDELNRVLRVHALAAGPLDGLPLDEEALRLLVTDTDGPQRIRLNRLILEAAYADEIARSYALERVTARSDQRVIMEAIRAHQAGPRPAMHLVVELADSGLYVEPVIVEVEADHTLELRAADGCRPMLVLPERSADIDDLVITCGDSSCLILDGLLVMRRPVRVIGQPAEVVVRDCTLVPGWELEPDCTPRSGEEPSLVLSDYAVDPPEEGAYAPAALQSAAPCIRIERSILGSIQVQRDEVAHDPLRLWIADSIVDATSRDLAAVSAPNDRLAHATLCVARSTIIGATLTHAIELGEDAIFFGALRVARRQIGCLRFCAVEEGSRTPRRYACQPDLAVEESGDSTRAEGVRPRFVSVRYGDPHYCLLADDGPPEIAKGAADESEMGVYHHLYRPQREANLRVRLREFIPLGWTEEIEFES